MRICARPVIFLDVDLHRAFMLKLLVIYKMAINVVELLEEIAFGHFFTFLVRLAA